MDQKLPFLTRQSSPPTFAVTFSIFSLLIVWEQLQTVTRYVAGSSLSRQVAAATVNGL